jgi:amidase
MSNELWRMGAVELSLGIQAKTFSSREVVESCLGRIEATNGQVNAITEIRSEAALDAADAADTAVANGDDLGSLHGIPVTIKGNIDIAGWATVNGCSALQENIAEHTSPCVQNWLNSGAILIGRTNTPEFSCRWETENDVFGPTRNPWNSELTPGGSSGGAAASLATGMTPLAHGTDLGGSLRQPAQACGIASIRPGQGRVPQRVPSEPEPAMGVQLMNVDGVMARSIADVRLGLTAMAARSWEDPSWVPAPLDVPDKSGRPIAVSTDPLGLTVHQQVADGITKAANALSAGGYAVENAEPSGLADAVRVWKDICISELLMGLEPAVKDICGPSLLRTFEYYKAAVPDVTPESYIQAFSRRRTVLRTWMEFFERYAVLVAPISTQPPQATNFDIASPESTVSTIESMSVTVAVNAMGLPSVVVPVGISGGLPQAVQVIGAPFEEMRCLKIAEIIEQELGSITPIDPV